MRTGLKTLSLLLISFLLVVLAPLSLVIYSVKSTILEPYSWNEYFQESGLYPKLSEYIQTHISVPEETDKSEESLMLQEATASAVSDTITIDWMASKVEFLQTAIWDYVLGKEERIQNVPISELTAALEREVHSRIDNMDKPEAYKNELRTKFDERVPTEIDIYDTYDIQDEDLQSLRSGYEKINKGMTMIGGLLAALILSGILIAFYPKWLLRWFGYTATCLGILCGLLYAGVKWINLEQRIVQLLSDKLGEWSEVVSQLIIDLLNNTLWMIWIAAIIALPLGIIAVIISHLPWIDRKNMAMHKHFALSNVSLAVRGVGLIVIFGVFSAFAFFFYSSM